MWPAAVLLCVCCGCQASPSKSAQPSSKSSASGSPVAVSTSAAPNATGAPTATASGPSAQQTPLAPFSELGRIVLTQEQGGPSLVRCDGVVFRVEIDVARKQWTYGTCPPSMPRGAPATPTDTLLTRNGVFDEGQLGELEKIYGKMLAQVAPGCGSDGGTLWLELWRRDGSSAGRYVNENWGCRKPPPIVAVGLGKFASAILLMLH